MSLRKHHLRKIETILQILKSSLHQSKRQIMKHQRINEEIVEELLQSDGIKHLSDVTSLKLIIYQLILHSLQPNQQELDREGRPNKQILHRMSKVLQQIKQCLPQIGEEKVDNKFLDRKNQKQNPPLDKSTKSKYKTYVSQLNQFKLYLSQLQKQQDGIQSCSNEQVLIQQLQHLVFKKEAHIQVLQKEKMALNLKISEIECQLQELKGQNNILFKEKMSAVEDNITWKRQVQELMQMNEESKIKPTTNMNSTYNSQSLNTIDEDILQQLYNDNELTRCLISQALTIQALLQ